MGTAPLSDIVSNDTAAASSPSAPGTAKLSDIVSNDTQAASSSSTPDQPGVITRGIEGAKQFAAPIAELVKPPESPQEHLLSIISPGGLPAYRMAKNLVAAAENTIKSTPAQYKQTVADFQRLADDFHNKDYRNALSSAVSAGSDVGMIPGGNDTRELAEGVRPSGNLAGPLVRQGLTAATMLAGGEAAAPAEAEAAAPALRINPFRISKIEPVVAAQTAKAGLPAGEAAVSTAEAAQKTVQAAEAAKTATQANVDSALQDIAKQHAAQNGLPAPAAGTASRDALASNGNALVDAGKADYKVLDKFTNGKFTNAQAELKNAQFELQQKAGTTDADVPTLEANVLRAQMNVDNLFDKAVESGMPKETAEAARTKFRTGQATLDAANDVRMANKVRGAAGTRTTDLNALENRWTARYDAGRLQQAFGEQGAKDALTQVHAARVMGDTFDAMPATESQALRELIEENTTTGKFGAKTNWLKVRDAFSKLPNRAAQFADVPKVEKFINDQAFYQRMRVAGKVAAGTVAGGALTSEGWNLAH